MVTLMDNRNASASAIANSRLNLADMDYLSTGKKARLHRLLYQFGPGNGTMMLLPIDQGLEHGPVDFFENPASADPDFQCQLAIKGGYSGIVFHIGLAEKYIKKYAGQIPLVLKINGKTCVPPDTHAFSTLTSTVEDAVRLGADAIGYTLYVGSSSQDQDILQFNEVRQEAERYGMPIIVWAYPRGEYIEKRGGKDSLYAIDYAARVACEVGADVVKINIPSAVEKNQDIQPDDYKTIQLSQDEKIRKVIQSAGKTMVIFSGGSKLSYDECVAQARGVMEQGAVGLIFGRNMWQRPMDEGVKLSQDISQMINSL
jgi:fructose-bisphosphate aldolase, class I